MASLLQRLIYKFVRAPQGYGRPLPKAVLDGEYSSGAWSHFHELPELSRQVLVAGLVPQLHSNPAVLDIGCGSGRLAQLFQPFALRRYVGVDISTEGLARARALNLPRCEFIEADFETWRPTGKFDVILFTECIGYARDPGALVAAFLPWLEPGGHVVISHFRFGHWEAHWRRIAAHTRVVEATTLTNSRGQTWDIKILQPRASS
jgi:SAM-dependent methyltransferase